MIKRILDDNDRAWLSGGIVLIVLCWAIGMTPWFVEVFKERGVIGDFFGGLSAPVIGLASIVLVYSAFKAQVLANRIQIQAIKDEREARKKEEQNRAIEDGFSRLEKILDRICYVRIDNGDVRNRYSGIDGVYRFAVDCKRNAGGPYFENEILMDTICHWLFEGRILLRKSKDVHSLDYAAVADRLKTIYAFSLAQCLNTLLETPHPPTLAEPFQRIAREKRLFDSMLGITPLATAEE
jgi:hypothetical protein